MSIKDHHPQVSTRLSLPQCSQDNPSTQSIHLHLSSELQRHPLSSGLESRPDSRTRNGVARHSGVDVDQNTRSGVLVKSSSLRALSARVTGTSGPATSNLDVDALRVVLSAVLALGGVQGDDFVAEDEVAGLEVGGDSHGPGVVVGW